MWGRSLPEAVMGVEGMVACISGGGRMRLLSAMIAVGRAT